ncbi:MAG: SMC-Scp complex subunit ScpB [Coriobacteriia bacterium]|nr:SMC-Scp complex subunit ScpB [Coriobacteriia bacterium]
MFQGLQADQLEGAVEALLFVTDEPVGTLTLAEMLQVDAVTVEQTLATLGQRLAETNSGIQLREVAGGWRLYTHPAYHELIEKYVISWDTRRLSQAALETLAVVAYSQPVTRAGVAAVRGVNSDSSINSLLDKGLLREAGAADTPGNPTLYATSALFLEKFGLRTVNDLPPLEEFAPDEQTKELIRTRLSATRVEDGEDNQEQLPFDQMDFEVVEDDEQLVALQDAAKTMMADALASAAGAVEKIDFDSLVFEDED